MVSRYLSRSYLVFGFISIDIINCGDNSLRSLRINRQVPNLIMAYLCTRCSKRANKLVEIGDVETTAWVSSETRVAMPQYNYVCLTCAFELLNVSQDDLLREDIPISEDVALIEEIEAQKSVMIAVSTGGPKIQEKNIEYQERRKRIRAKLHNLSIKDPNPFPDLWAWYGKWSSGDLPTYQSRREYISALYQPLIDSLDTDRLEKISEPVLEPTGWARVDRVVDKIIYQLETAKTEEDFQVVGLLCRETLISLAQAVFDPTIHTPVDNVAPSDTDAKRMLDSYFSSELAGSSNEGLRKHAKASLSLANELQHKRTANIQVAALCAEATRTVVNIVAIISGIRGV